MILGIGTDITDMRRVKNLMEQHGDRFADKYFTAEEKKRAEESRATDKHMESYTKRWAAKEACAKALGRGIRNGISMKDIGVINNENGRPSLILSGGALARLNDLIPAGKTANVHLSLSDEPPYAIAYVIIEAV